MPLVAIMKQRLDELAEIIFGERSEAPAGAGPVVPERRPFVSIHIPAYREPPEMLRQTLDSVAKLDWPNFECIVVINNTPEASYWRPIEEHCEPLGPRFKFVNAERLEGFKAGALRLALEHTAPEAEIIGVLDADYVVDPDWLKDLVPAFAAPTVGLVQAPQDHRDGGRSLVHAVMNREYAGFFDIGMVQRNEVERHRLARHHVPHPAERADRLRLMVERHHRRGCRSRPDAARARLALHYTRRRYGWGLLPSDFAAYKRQRHRWAYGGVQLDQEALARLRARTRRGSRRSSGPSSCSAG